MGPGELFDHVLFMFGSYTREIQRTVDASPRAARLQIRYTNDGPPSAKAVQTTSLRYRRTTEWFALHRAALQRLSRSSSRGALRCFAAWPQLHSSKGWQLVYRSGF